MIKPGDKVVCVDDSPCKCGNCDRAAIGLVLNRIYMVNGFLVHPDRNVLCLVLCGDWPDDAWHHTTNSFGATRFRKLDEMRLQSELEQLKKTRFEFNL